MRPVKTRIPATELYRENDDVAKVGLGYKRNAFNFFKISGARKGSPNAVTGIRAVGKQVVVLYRTDSQVLDSELFIFRKHVVLCRYEKGFGTVSYTHLRAHETRHDLVCRLLLEKK